ELEGEPYRILNEWFIASGREAAKHLDVVLDKRSRDGPRAADSLARRQAHAAVVLLHLEDWDSPAKRGPWDPSEPIRADRLWPLLRESSDARLRSLRSYLIPRFARVNIKPEVLIERYAAEADDASARRALLLSLGEFQDYQFRADSREGL